MSDSRRIDQLQAELRELRELVQDLRGILSGRQATVHSKKGGGGVALYRYQLGTHMAVSSHPTAKGESTGSTLTPIGSSLTIETGITLYDYTGTAAHQLAGDTGLAVKSGGEFIAIEPECNFESFTPTDPPVV